MKYLLTGYFLSIAFAVTFAQDIRILVKPVDSKFWGYSDANGKVYDAKYLYCEPFSEDGVAVVYSSARKQYRIINRFGREIETEVTDFDVKDYLSYYPGQFTGGYLVMRMANRWGAMDTTGKVIVPMKWKTLLEFEKGYGIGVLKDRFSVINARTGRETLLDEEIVEMKPFQEGMAPAKFKNGKEGFIDTTGRIAIKPEFQQVGYFFGGIAWAKNIEGMIGYINKSAEWVINPFYTAVKNMDPVSGLARVMFNEKWYYISLKGEMIDFGMSEIMDDFHDGLSKGRKDGKWGFLNSKGEWVIKPRFVNARDFKNGYAAVSIQTNNTEDELWGIIDTTGNWLIEPKFRMAKDVVVLKP
ncbi:MAG TPA: WG repeat-containing protein [Bacteroidales bacterium]|nr:WG repeat-containing protein [Bacteroidales bacterium]